MSETLQIKIAPEHDAAHDDDLGRTINGFYSGIDPGTVWPRACGVWRLDPHRVRAVAEVEVVGGPDDIVLAVATVDDLEEFHGKYAIVGTVLPAHPRVGRPSPHPHPSRNRINYY